jgi:DNA-binding CsgD family transcriptional regulator
VLGCEVVASGRGRRSVAVAAAAAADHPAEPLVDAFCARYGVSPREREVIGLLLEGRGTSEMASRLSISEHTVRDHLKSLYRKTGTRSRSELISVVSTARMEPAASLDRC